MEKNLIIKANKLNESRYKLSVQEQRIILSMISMIKPKDKDFKPYGFKVQEFMKLVGIKGHGSYSEIKKITKNLRNKGFTITEPDGDLQIGWLSSVKYYDNEGYFELSFDPKLKPYLLALKKEFTRYQLKNTIRLKSVYSIRIYELLKQYQSIGYRYFDLEKLRSLLGISEDTFKLYGHFKVRVIEKAKKELINTDIAFTYEPVKSGRRVTGLNFIIVKNSTVVKNSYKKKASNKKIKIEQIDPNLQDKKQDVIFKKLDLLQEHYPDVFKKLEKKAKSRIPKKKLIAPGFKLTIRFKMADLMEMFIKGFKIQL